MTKFVFCHHAERADRGLGKESDRFPGITIKGEKQTREKTKVLAQMIGSLLDGSVVVLGGCSRAIRTASTLAVFTDELRQMFIADENVVFSKPFNPVSPLDALKEASMKSGSGGKIIIDFPLKIEEFISFPGQKGPAMARRMVSGLSSQAGFFGRFFPRNPMVLVNVGHTPETDALISFLHKRSGDALTNIVNFM